MKTTDTHERVHEHVHEHEHAHEHGHGHHHHHHHEAQIDPSLKKTYIIAMVLNLGFVAVEAVIGFIHHSMGLLSDAGHNLSDVISLLLAMVAFGLMSSHARKGFTYGYRKSTVLISLVNSVILLVAVGAIVLESIHKFAEPSPVSGAAISWTAGVGILVNGFTTFLLMRKRKLDINTRGAYLHMLADTLVSVGVVISGIVIGLTGWYFIDPAIGLVVAAVILFGTIDILRESLRLSMDAVPEGINENEIAHLILGAEGVLDVHHIHIWPISTTQTALTAHIVVSDPAAAPAIVHSLKHELSEHGISHSTIEVESPGSHCEDPAC